MVAAQRQAVVDEARSWVGTPYHHHARVKGVGVDCGQLLIGVFAGLGLIPADVDPGEYSPEWHLHRGRPLFLEFLERFADEVICPEPGSVIMFDYGRTSSHGGIVTRWPLVVHAIRVGQRVIEEDITTAPDAWGRAIGFWALRSWLL